MTQGSPSGGTPAGFFRIAAFLSKHSGKNAHVAALAAAAERVAERIALGRS